MTAPPGRHDSARQRLAALVEQRRVALGWSKEKAAAACDGLAYMTYDRVENGEGVQARTLARIEKGLGFAPGAFRAVLEGAKSVVLEDGTEIHVVEIAAAIPPRDVEERVRSAMHNAMVTGTDLDADKIRGATERAIQELRKSGVLPSEGDGN